MFGIPPPSLLDLSHKLATVKAQIPQTTLVEFSLALFQIIHVVRIPLPYSFSLGVATQFPQALEDLSLQDNEQAPTTNEFVAAMYIASSLFVPSHQSYYRRLLTLFPCGKILESVDPICKRIALSLEVWISSVPPTHLLLRSRSWKQSI
jgi:hypothetical protein